MKLFTADFSWAGVVVVVANTEEEAREIMSKSHSHYTDDTVVTEQWIVLGTVICNLGATM
jgi:hypothetical protein